MQKAKRKLALSRSKVPVPADGLDEIKTIATAKTLDELRWAQTHSAKKSLEKALQQLGSEIDEVVASLTGEQMACNEDKTQRLLVSRLQVMYKSKNQLQNILTMVDSAL